MDNYRLHAGHARTNSGALVPPPPAAAPENPPTPARRLRFADVAFPKPSAYSVYAEKYDPGWAPTEDNGGEEFPRSSVRLDGCDDEVRAERLARGLALTDALGDDVTDVVVRSAAGAVVLRQPVRGAA